MILLPKYKDLHVKGPLRLNTGIEGEYRCILYKGDGKTVISDTGWRPNLITNNGLNIYRTEGSPFGQTHIGSGTTPAANGDTAMETFLASSNTVGSGDDVTVYNGAPDYEYSATLSRRFAAGEGTGTINEIGMGPNDAGTNIFNRHIVSPPIPKGAAQVLDVVFRITHWPQISDVTGTVTIDGISYDTITRGSGYSPNIHSIFSRIDEVSLFTADWQAYDGDLGTLVGTPSGDASPGNASPGIATYVANNHYIDITHFAELNQWNPALGIRSIRGKTNVRNFQTQFDATSGGARIPKDGTKILDITWRYSWARR